MTGDDTAHASGEERPRLRTASLAASLIGVALLAMVGGPIRLLELVLAIAALVTLLRHPEFALALYVVAGDVKGDERISAMLPFDLTITLGAVLIVGILLNLLRGKPIVAMPPIYFLLLALTGIMAVSLGYTPVFSAGLEKLGRFLSVTAIVIVAPFFVLSDVASMNRFLFCFASVAYAICLYSLAGLGGPGRLVTPSDNTIGLGRVACVLAVMIWVAAAPRAGAKNRILTYLLLAVPVIAMIGSGARGAATALAIVFVVSLFFYRRLLLDVAVLLALGFATLPLIKVPEASLAYLGTLLGTRSLGGLLEFRGDLLDYGWKLFQRHPLIGVGIGGYRYSSPNPGMYKWPHNIFLEVACELGIAAALIVVATFAAAIRESWRQLRDPAPPCLKISIVAAALLLVGIVNALNTGDINSDRSAWLFLSLVFVIRGYRLDRGTSARVASKALSPARS